MKAPNSSLSILLIAALTFFLGVHAGPPAAAGGLSSNDAVGTYFFETVTASTGELSNGFLTLNRGGTATWADQSDFGGSGFFNSTTHRHIDSRLRRALYTRGSQTRR